MGILEGMGKLLKFDLLLVPALCDALRALFLKVPHSSSIAGGKDVS